MNKRFGAIALSVLLLFSFSACAKEPVAETPDTPETPGTQETPGTPETPGENDPSQTTPNPEAPEEKVTYQSVRKTVEGEIAARIALQGTPNASVRFRVYYMGEDRTWHYTEYTDALDATGAFSLDYPLPEGTVEVMVEINESLQTTETGSKKVPASATVELIREELGPLIPPPVQELSYTMPSVGDVRIFSVFVEFPDRTFSASALSCEEIREEFFGTGKEAVPYESLTAWFGRSSYQNLNIDGDVYRYTCAHPIESYIGDNQEALIMEVLEGLDDEVDFSQYDSNGDGFLDQFSVCIPTEGASAALRTFWACATYTWYEHDAFAVDGKSVNQFVALDMPPVRSQMSYMKSSLIHEMGHCMGMPDFYKYTNQADWQGFHGDAGYTCLDDAVSDFCGFSKLMYGWLRESQLHVYQGTGEVEYEIDSLSKKGSLLLLPIWGEGYFTEYFVVEYITPENNNVSLKAYAKQTSGVRIFHIQAETALMRWGTVEFKYNNYSQYYQGDDAIRVIRLVNDGNGFFRPGDEVTYSTSGFAAYDERGKESVDTGYRIAIGEVNGSKIAITVSKD